PGVAKIATFPLIEPEPRQDPLEEAHDLLPRYHESFLWHGGDGREPLPEEVGVCPPIADAGQLAGRPCQHIPTAAVGWNGGGDVVWRYGFDVHALCRRRVHVDDRLGHVDRE